MTASPLLTVFLPLALAIIMLGLGLSLTVADFTRVAKFPKPVVLGLFCQILLLPLACFFIAKAFGLAPALAVGLMLLAASPGGTTANLFSHLAHGDVALNITLTAINSVLAILTLPLVVNLSLAHFMGADGSLPLQFDKMVQVFVIVLVPVAIGMGLRQRWPAFAARMEKPVNRALRPPLPARHQRVALRRRSGCARSRESAWDRRCATPPALGPRRSSCRR